MKFNIKDTIYSESDKQKDEKHKLEFFEKCKELEGHWILFPLNNPEGNMFELMYVDSVSNTSPYVGIYILLSGKEFLFRMDDVIYSPYGKHSINQKIFDLVHIFEDDNVYLEKAKTILNMNKKEFLTYENELKTILISKTK